MAKMLKQLVFGQKKNPPAPPRPDYEGDRSRDLPYDSSADTPFFDHDYENIPKLKGRSQVRFAEKKESELLVFDNYSEPADLRAQICPLECEDPLYMSPVDEARGSAPPLPEEEEMYCVPYDASPTDPPPLPLPCLAQGRAAEGPPEDTKEANYDVVPEEEEAPSEHERGQSSGRPRSPLGNSHEYEYDEPWEWSVGARLTSSLQVSPEQSAAVDCDSDDDSEMATRQQRRLYETAFDSRVKRKEEEGEEDLLQSSPLFRPARAASRSSFGSTSGSSASSTPTHQPMDTFTPTERRKVTLVRDHAQPRSMSPQARSSGAVRGVVKNQNFERKISFLSSSPQWDGVSRCSDRSSSQESMSVEVVSSRGGSRDSLGDRNPNPWTSAKLQDGDKSVVAPHQTPVKVLPADGIVTHSNSPRFSKTRSSKSSCDLAATSQQPASSQPPPDPELKENNSVADEQQSEDSNLPQSPENDGRTSQDYDPPWDLKGGKQRGVLRPAGGVNGSVSVPERLSSCGPTLTTSVTHGQLDTTAEASGQARAANRPNGSRPSLNLNLGSSDSPRKGLKPNLTLNFGCAALSAVGEKVDPQLTLEKQGWYHGSISRVDAEGKLRVLKEGSYLVRNSESSKQDYSLSLKSARGFMHMKIVPTSEGRFILGQFSNPFASIPEMIQHYSLNKLPIKGAEHMSLLYPVMDQLL